jgi:hypothetical protein
VIQFRFEQILCSLLVVAVYARLVNIQTDALPEWDDWQVLLVQVMPVQPPQNTPSRQNEVVPDTPAYRT